MGIDVGINVMEMAVIIWNEIICRKICIKKKMKQINKIEHLIGAVRGKEYVNEIHWVKLWNIRK